MNIDIQAEAILELKLRHLLQYRKFYFLSNYC